MSGYRPLQPGEGGVGYVLSRQKENLKGKKDAIECECEHVNKSGKGVAVISYLKLTKIYVVRHKRAGGRLICN